MIEEYGDNQQTWALLSRALEEQEGYIHGVLRDHSGREPQDRGD
jgi:hypothetical protein